MLHHLSMKKVGMWSWINSRKMDFACSPSIHKIDNKVDGMIFEKNIIIDNYKLFY